MNEEFLISRRRMLGLSPLRWLVCAQAAQFYLWKVTAPDPLPQCRKQPVH